LPMKLRGPWQMKTARIVETQESSSPADEE
jgi:hypothetical protein